MRPAVVGPERREAAPSRGGRRRLRGSLGRRRWEGIPGERAPGLGRVGRRGPLRAFAGEDPPPGATRGFPVGPGREGGRGFDGEAGVGEGGPGAFLGERRAWGAGEGESELRAAVAPRL